MSSFHPPEFAGGGSETRLQVGEKLNFDNLAVRGLTLTDFIDFEDFSRQNLTSVDVRFCRLKSIPAYF